MSRRGRFATIALAAVALLVALPACGEDDSGSEAGATTASGDGDYIAKANAICRQGVREAQRIGRQGGSIDPGNVDTITAIFVKPGLALLERQGERLRRLDAPADDLPRDRTTELGGRKRHLADGLAPTDDAVVGVDGEEDEVCPDLRAARPVELLRERDGDRDRVDSRDPHAAGARVGVSRSEGRSSAMRRTAHSSDSRITSWAASGSPALHAS